MVKRILLVTLALCLAGATASFAADSPHMGTWKLNEATSKISPGSPKNQTVLYEAAGDNVKVTVDGVDGSGQPTHNVWTGKFDGKDYPLTGDPTADTRSYNKVMTTGRLVVSADGKNRTVTTTVTSPHGQKVNTTAVYDKQ